MNKKASSYPLLGVHDVLPEQILTNRWHHRAVYQQRLLRGTVAVAAAGVVPDVGAHNEASQHLVLDTESGQTRVKGQLVVMKRFIF